MLLEIVLLVIAVWFVFGAGFWGLFVQLGLRFEERRRAASPDANPGVSGRALSAATTFARRAQRDPLPGRHVPITWV